MERHLATILIESFFLIIKQLGSVRISILMLMISFSVFAQKSITNQDLIWYGYYNTLVFNEKWALASEIQERHFINPLAQHQLVFRSHLQRTLGSNWNTYLGMTYFLQSPQDPKDESNLIVPELRPYIGFDNKQKLSFGILSHRYKVEARFFHDVEDDRLVGGYRFSNYRVRYQLGLDIPIIRKKDSREGLLSVRVKNEIFFNLGRKIVKNTFDQNRIYLGMNYKINSTSSVEVGYINWFQQRVSGVDYYNRNIIRFSLFHTIFLKNK